MNTKEAELAEENRLLREEIFRLKVSPFPHIS